MPFFPKFYAFLCHFYAKLQNSMPDRNYRLEIMNNIRSLWILVIGQLKIKDSDEGLKVEIAHPCQSQFPEGFLCPQDKFKCPQDVFSPQCHRGRLVPPSISTFPCLEEKPKRG